MTRKELLKIAASMGAIDVTSWSNDKLYGLGHLERVAASHGVYGVNAILCKDERGAYYVVSSRSTALFIVM